MHAPHATGTTRQFLTAREAAAQLGVDPRTITRWIHSGRLVGYKVTHWRINLADWRRFLASTRYGN